MEEQSGGDVIKCAPLHKFGSLEQNVASPLIRHLLCWPVNLDSLLLWKEQELMLKAPHPASSNQMVSRMNIDGHLALCLRWLAC